MEFKEFSNPEENDYDIKSSLESSNQQEENIEEEEILDDAYDVIYHNNKDRDVENDMVDGNIFSGNFIEEDIFEDESIEETLRKYNYDYKFLMRELTSFINYSELMDILKECNIKKEEYLNPTYEIFDIIRDKIINKKIRAKI